MFWLATLNPGGKKARKHRRGRKLWGAALAAHLKKAGGVKSSFRKRRRKSKKLWGAALAAHTKKLGRSSRRVRRSRRSGKKRHSRKTISVNPMAKTRRRRSKKHRSRNPWAHIWRAGRSSKKYKRGQFSRSRKWRRNAVVPVSWNPKPRRRRRNAVVPVSWNPRRRRNGRRHRKSPRRRRNPVLPYFAMNPGGAIVGAITMPFQKFMNVGFWTNTALPATAGFLGTQIVGATIHAWVGEKVLGITPATQPTIYPWTRIGANAVGAGLLSWVAGRFVSVQAGQAVFIGGVVSVTYSILRQLLGGTQIGNAIGLSGLGDIASQMRAQVAQRLSGARMGTYMTDRNLLAQPASLSGARMGTFITDRDLRSQSGYSALPNGSLVDHDVTSEMAGLGY